MTIIRNYLITFIVFLVIDFIWLGLVARNLYRDQIGFLMKDGFDMTAAFIFYFIFTAGILFFVLNNALELSSWRYALFVGMLYGFITYSTYDLTNLATLKDWPLMITVIDMLWGTFLAGLTSLLSYNLINFFK